MKSCAIFLLVFFALWCSSNGTDSDFNMGLINTQDNRVKNLQHDFYLEHSFHIFQNVTLYWYMYLREADIKEMPNFTHGHIKKVYFLLRKMYTVVNFGSIEQWVEIPHDITYYEWTVPPIESTHYFISFLVFFETPSTADKPAEGHSVLVHSNAFDVEGFSLFLSLSHDLIWYANESIGLRVSSLYPIPKGLDFYAQLRKMDSFVSHSLTHSDNNVIETVRLDFEGELDTLIYFPVPENFSNSRFNGSLYNFVLVCRERMDLDNTFYYRIAAYSVAFRMQGLDELGTASPCVYLEAPPFAVKEPLFYGDKTVFTWKHEVFPLNKEFLFTIHPPAVAGAMKNATVKLLRNCNSSVLVGSVWFVETSKPVIIGEPVIDFNSYNFIHAFSHPGVYCWSLNYGEKGQIYKSNPFSVRGHRIEHIHDNTVWHPAGKNGFAIRFEPAIKVTKFRMEVLHDKMLIDTENFPFAATQDAIICTTEYVFEEPYQLSNQSMIYFNALMGPTFNRHMFWKYGYYIRLYVTEQYEKPGGRIEYFTFPLAESLRFTIYPDHGLKHMDSLHLMDEESIDPVQSYQKLEPSTEIAVMDTRLAVFYLLVTAIIPLCC